MKNLFLNRINLNKDTITLDIKLKQLDLNMLFIQQNDFILGYNIDTVTYTEPNSTEIKLKSIVPIKVGKEFLHHLYSDAQLKKNTNNSGDLAATASLNSTTQYSFPFAYATIDFTQATQEEYLPILNAYTENLLLKQSTDKQTTLTPFDYKVNMLDKEGAELLFTHLSLRAGRAATIITSNLTFERWEEVFHDPVLTSALTDRLTHRAHIINMIGGSYRILETKEWMEQSNF